MGQKTGTFDNSMGSIDGCEICELIGLYLLCKMGEEETLKEVEIALLEMT